MLKPGFHAGCKLQQARYCVSMAFSLPSRPWIEYAKVLRTPSICISANVETFQAKLLGECVCVTWSLLPSIIVAFILRLIRSALFSFIKYYRPRILLSPMIENYQKVQRGSFPCSIWYAYAAYSDRSSSARSSGRWRITRFGRSIILVLSR